jgi:hypothetical protein
LFLGPRIPFQVVGGTLVQLSKNLMLIDGDKKAVLKCRIQERIKNIFCTWREGEKQEEDRKYQVALMVPRSLLNCTANNVKNIDHQLDIHPRARQ